MRSSYLSSNVTQGGRAAPSWEAYYRTKRPRLQRSAGEKAHHNEGLASTGQRNIEHVARTDKKHPATPPILPPGLPVEQVLHEEMIVPPLPPGRPKTPTDHRGRPEDASASLQQLSLWRRLILYFHESREHGHCLLEFRQRRYRIPFGH